MERITAFKTHCINDKGYSPDDVVLIGDDIRDFPAAKVVISKVDRISYPLDESIIRDCLKSGKCQTIVITDGMRLHIFILDDDKLTEVSDVPDMISDGASAELAEAKSLKSRLWEIMDRFRFQGIGYQSMSNLLAFAVQIYRDDAWDEVRNAKDLGFLDRFRDEIEAQYPGAIVGDFGKIDANLIIRALLSFSNLKLDGPRFCTAEVYTKIFDERTQYNNNPTASEFLTSFCKGKTAMMSAIDIGLFDIAVNRSGQKVDLFYYGPDQYIQVIRFLCKDKCNFHKDYNLSDQYDTVIVSHFNFSMLKNMASSENGDPMVINLDDVMNHIRPGGRLVLLAHQALFMGRFPIKDWLYKNFKISFIGELNNPWAGTRISGFLVVIDKCPADTCIIAKDPMTVDQLLVVPDLLSDSSKDQVAVSEGFCVISQKLFGDNWHPRLLLNTLRDIMYDIETVDLEDVASIFRGISVPSKEYIKDGFGGIPFLRVSNIHNQSLDIDSCVNIPAQYARIVSETNDIVMSVTGTIGKLAMVEDEVFVPSTQTVLIRPNHYVNAEKLMKALQSDMVQDQIDACKRGTVISNVPISDLRKIKIPKEMIM